MLSTNQEVQYKPTTITGYPLNSHQPRVELSFFAVRFATQIAKQTLPFSSFDQDQVLETTAQIPTTEGIARISARPI